MKQKKTRLNIMAAVFLLLILTLTFGAACVYADTPVATDFSISLDNKGLTSDVPVYAENNFSLVPARVIFENAGGTIAWDGDAQKVTINYNSQKVELTVNSTTAYVNGKATAMNVPARLIVVDPKTGASRTMIPLRFVSESLSFKVDYYNDTRSIALTSPAKTEPEDSRVQITAVDSTRSGNMRIVTVHAASSLGEYSDLALTDPTRYVVDLQNTVLGTGVLENLSVSDSSSPVTAVRSGQFDANTVRIVIDLSSKSTPTVNLSADKKMLTVTIPDLNSSVQPPVTNDPTVPPDDPTNTIPVNKKPSSLNEVLIVIDPGHGGAYPGSVGKLNGQTVLYEKEPNLDVALRLNKKLQAAGLNTVMTHETDSLCDPNAKTSSEDLISRSTFANEKNATLFISIHNNSADNIPNAKGTETLYNETEGKAAYGISSKELATRVQKNMIAYCGTTNRGAKSRPDLSVLRRTEMPAIIVEGAFLSNINDLQLLLSDDFREKYASAVADAVIEYLNELF